MVQAVNKADPLFVRRPAYCGIALAFVTISALLLCSYVVMKSIGDLRSVSFDVDEKIRKSTTQIAYLNTKIWQQMYSSFPVYTKGLS